MRKVVFRGFLLFIQILFVNSVWADSGKKFIFKPDFGKGYFDFNANKPDLFGDQKLKPMIEEYFSIAAKNTLGEGFGRAGEINLKVFGYNELSSKKFVVFGFLTAKEDVLRVITPDYLYNTKPGYKLGFKLGSPRNMLLAVVDLEQKTVERLKVENPVVLSTLLAQSSGKYSSGSIQVYGCLQGYPIILADVNNDLKLDLLFVGGGGSIYLPNEEISAYTELTIFLNDENYFKELVSFELHEEEFNFYFDQSGNKYQVVRDQVGQRMRNTEKPNEFVRGSPDNLRPGYRNFSKVYFDDFDSDGIFSGLIWNRSFISAEKSSSINGFISNGERFEIFDIVNPAKKIMLTNEQGHSILRKNNLKWEDGFPSENKCYGNANISLPVVLDYGHPKLSIQDLKE